MLIIMTICLMLVLLIRLLISQVDNNGNMTIIELYGETILKPLFQKDKFKIGQLLQAKSVLEESIWQLHLQGQHHSQKQVGAQVQLLGRRQSRNIKVMQTTQALSIQTNSCSRYLGIRLNQEEQEALLGCKECLKQWMTIIQSHQICMSSQR